MLSIDPEGRIKIGNRYRGTVKVPGRVHPEAMEVIQRWKEMRALADQVDKPLFQVTAGEDYDEVSARARFSVPDQGMKAANKLDEDLRKIWEDLIGDAQVIGVDPDAVQLESEIPIDLPLPMIWTLSVVAIPSESIENLKPILGAISDAVRETRLEEFAVLS